MGLDGVALAGIDAGEPTAVRRHSEDEGAGADECEEGVRHVLVGDARLAEHAELAQEDEARFDLGVDEPAGPRVEAVALVDDEAEELGMGRHRAHILPDQLASSLRRFDLDGRFGAGGDALGDRLEHALGRGPPQVVLGREVVREQALLEAGGLGDFPGAGGLEAPVGEGLDRSRHDAGAGGFCVGRKPSSRSPAVGAILLGSVACGGLV